VTRAGEGELKLVEFSAAMVEGEVSTDPVGGGEVDVFG